MTETLTRLLYITPPASTATVPCDDELTVAMVNAFADARITATWRGTHTCACGERSSNADYAVGRFETNSLCVHYLRWHRDAVPERELNKVRELAGIEPVAEPEPGVTFLGRPISEWDPAELQRAMNKMVANSTWNPQPAPSASRGLFQTRPSHHRRP